MSTFNTNNFKENKGGLPVRSSSSAPCVKQMPQVYRNGLPIHHNGFSKQQTRVQLPAGTFRRGDYDKTILLSDGNKTRKFHFLMCYGYWDDPNYGETGSQNYRLYILSFPNKPDFGCCSSHEAHMFYDEDRCDYFVCWDQPITSFQDANAVAFVWAKNFLAHCMNDSNSHKRIYLPSGTFRAHGKSGKKHSKKTVTDIGLRKQQERENKGFDYYRKEPDIELTYKKYGSEILVTKQVYAEIQNKIGLHSAERGGMLGSTDGKTVDVFVYDKYAKVDGAAYSPDVEYLNEVLQKWEEEDITFVGFVHSHPVYFTHPSTADESYAEKIMKAFGISEVFMPIVMTEPDYGHFRIYPYIIALNNEKEAECYQCTMEITSEERNAKTMQYSEFEKITESESTMTEQEIMERFEAMNADERKQDKEGERVQTPEEPAEELSDTAFDRVSNALDLKLLKRSLIIGIGCGGAREFYLDMVRCGVGNFLLMDGDTVSQSNLSSQNVYACEIGKYKTDVTAERIHQINEGAVVKSVPEYLDDIFCDGWFESMVRSFKGVKNILLCGFTDSFAAQARCARLAMKYKFMYVSAQHYYKGLASEIIYWHPKYSVTSPRSYLKDRYDSYLNKGFKNNVTSKGSPIFNTVRLNSLCEKIAIGLLMKKSKKNDLYSDFLTNIPEKNLILIRQHSLNGQLPGIDVLFEGSSSPFDDCIWLSAEEMGVESGEDKDSVDFGNDSPENKDSRELA